MLHSEAWLFRRKKFNWAYNRWKVWIRWLSLIITSSWICHPRQLNHESKFKWTEKTWFSRLEQATKCPLMNEYQSMRQPTTRIVRSWHGTTSKKSHKVCKFPIGFKLLPACRSISKVWKRNKTALPLWGKQSWFTQPKTWSRLNGSRL